MGVLPFRQHENQILIWSWYVYNIYIYNTKNHSPNLSPSAKYENQRVFLPPLKLIWAWTVALTRAASLWRAALPWLTSPTPKGPKSPQGQLNLRIGFKASIPFGENSTNYIKLQFNWLLVFMWNFAPPTTEQWLRDLRKNRRPTQCRWGQIDEQQNFKWSKLWSSWNLYSFIFTTLDFSQVWANSVHIEV